MVEEFQFSTAGRIIFGRGQLAVIGGIAKEFGTRAFVVTGKDADRAAPLLEILEAHGVHSMTFPVDSEPTVALAKEATSGAAAYGAHLVLGFGGGSALDTGKAVSALLTNGGDPRPFLEVIGEGQPLSNRPIPYLAIPTTSGTGTEVTRNAVLASKENRVKVSLRSRMLIPDVALIDPDLTVTVPPEVTARTGLDALTQVIEPYISRRRNPMTDGFCLVGIRRAARSLLKAAQDGKDITARVDMSVASLMGGLALANAGLGAAHGFAGPFGGMYHAPHGAICAALLPYTMQVNLAAIEARSADEDLRTRFDQIGKLLTGRQEATAADGVAWLQNLCEELAIPGLDQFGLLPEEVEDLIEKSRQSSSMKGNPIELTRDELEQIIALAR
ncbi:MAG: iron-containing alcohol dehydrogenase [Anaerolineales bacterium]|jgi:alcohol dehydrogenase class IV